MYTLPLACIQCALSTAALATFHMGVLVLHSVHKQKENLASDYDLRCVRKRVMLPAVGQLLGGSTAAAPSSTLSTVRSDTS